MTRRAKIDRKTGETSIKVTLKLDGKGTYKIQTPIPFLNHMLELFTRHGLFDIDLSATGDTEVDFHHTVEDVGICLGKAFDKALGEKKGICRYGHAAVPMDETLTQVTIDLSGRPYLKFRAELPKEKVGEFDLELAEEFFRAFTNHIKANLHINLLYGENLHHILESIFKATARALRQATGKDPGQAGIPSTKGVLE
ncbi:MAG: imidazoleglycerol-phosphate dehydratase HisB [Deltaproteobacteria bacterium]|nr:imidazoleglycerol-phosphate dehydratase HisB [Deltaproteobacteria bacterium]